MTTFTTGDIADSSPVWPYVAGAWEARGGCVISQSAAYFGVRLWVETLARRPMLDALFGEPSARLAYRRPTWRYEATDKATAAHIAEKLCMHVGKERRGELQALIRFCAALTAEDRALAAAHLADARPKLEA